MFSMVSLFQESVEVEMCGRFMLISSGAVIAERFCVDRTMEFERRYNIAPGQEIVGISMSRDNFLREMRSFHWGFVPSWSKDGSIGARLVNARSETILEKPAFRNAFKSRRLLIPSNGFYEWNKNVGTRIPFLIGMKDNSVFAMAGIWEEWKSSGNHALTSCCILTTHSNELTGRIHDRMPVIVKPEHYSEWLAQARLPERLSLEILKSFPADLMRMREVSPKVNKTDYDQPDCIDGDVTRQVNWMDDT